MLAIGVSVALVVATTYIAYGQPLGGGPAWVVEPAAGVEVDGPEVELARDILEDRLGALDIEARLSIEDDGRIRVQVPADADESLVDRVLGSVGLLEFTPVPSACALEVIPDAPQPACLDEAEPLFDGTEIALARIGQDPTTAEIVVSLELKETGARLFDEHAGQVYDSPNPNERLFAIVLDGTVVSAPSINAPRFGGAAQISGNFSLEEAGALVAALQAGRVLPYAVSVSGEA
jgi:preprotein translocase subunit SecD